MIRSMTGYGKGSSDLPGLRVTVELRSVNNRYADLRLRLPAELFSEEGEIRRRVLAKVRRGRIEMGLDVARTEGADRGVTLNRPLVRAIAESARELEREFGIEGRVDVNTVLSLPDVLERDRPLDHLDESGRVAVHRAVDSALEALDAERRREGAALATEIRPRLARVEELVEEIGRLAGELPAAAQKKLLERIDALVASAPLDPARMAQEAAFLADRYDVTEEVVRLRGHVGQASALLSRPDGEPIGKRLDFLLQEIHRETNTVNSKSANLEISRRALEIKSETEKVREQIQNLE